MRSVADRERILTIRSDISEYDHVLITLEDAGTGIEPDHMDRIFDAFFTTKASGIGMGLSICRSIIESHGGRLWASRRNPHGSIFYIKLPRARANDDPTGQADDRQAQVKLTHPAIPGERPDIGLIT